MDAAVVLAALLGLGGGVLVGVLAVLGVHARRGRGSDDPVGDDALPGSADDGALPHAALDVLSALDGPVVLLDAVDGVLRASPAAWSAGLVRGRGLASAELVEAVRGTRRDAQPRRLEVELARAALGQGRAVFGVRTVLLDGGHVLLVATDRTQARLLDEVRRDFVVNISHELKTPVGAMALLAEAIDDAADDAQAVRRFAGRMQAEARRLGSLVQDVIDLSRVQGAVASPQREPVDVDEVVAEAVDRCRMTAESRGIALETGSPTRARVLGDAEMLTTAVRNLVDNAVRYSEPGTRVGVGVRRADGVVEVAVTDQGIGISPEEQGRVFERFYRVDPARSRVTGGTGLGLSIVKHVVANHGGEVAVWSQVGQGSTFTLRLPEAAGAGEGAEAAHFAEHGRSPSA